MERGCSGEAGASIRRDGAKRKWIQEGRCDGRPLEAAATKLSSLAMVDGNGLDSGFGRGLHRESVLEAVENLVGSVLEPGVWLVELAGSLGGKLAELITVADVCEGSKNKI
jgi:hypothetical protein